MSLEKIGELKNTIWKYLEEWKNFSAELRDTKAVKAILKGIVPLLEHSEKRARLRFSKIAIHIYDVLYNEKIRLSPEE